MEEDSSLWVLIKLVRVKHSLPVVTVSMEGEAHSPFQKHWECEPALVWWGGGGDCKEGLVPVSLEKPWRILWCAALEVGWGTCDNPHKKDTDTWLSQLKIYESFIGQRPTEGLCLKAMGPKLRGTAFLKAKATKTIIYIKVTWESNLEAFISGRI